MVDTNGIKLFLLRMHCLAILPDVVPPSLDHWTEIN